MLYCSDETALAALLSLFIIIFPVFFFDRRHITFEQSSRTNCSKLNLLFYFAGAVIIMKIKTHFGLFQRKSVPPVEISKLQILLKNCSFSGFLNPSCKEIPVTKITSVFLLQFDCLVYFLV